jgi:hypothetical protein
MVKANLHMLAVLFTQVSGKMGNSMGMALRNGLMELSISANTATGEKKDLGFSSG